MKRFLIILLLFKGLFSSESSEASQTQVTEQPKGLLYKIARSLTSGHIPHNRNDLVTFFNKKGMSTLLIKHVGISHIESWLDKGFFLVLPNLMDDAQDVPDLLLMEIDGIWMRFFNHDPIKKADYIKLREKRPDFSFFVFQVSWDFFEDLFLSFNEGVIGRDSL